MTHRTAFVMGPRRRHAAALRSILAAALAGAVCLAGCFKHSTVLTSGEPGPENDASAAPNGSGGASGSFGAALGGTGTGTDSLQREPLGPEACTRGGSCSEIAVITTDKVDLLFAIDNSGSMQEEQQALRVQFPQLLERLTNADGTLDVPFAFARDLHLGVVSSDLGLVGIPDIASCAGLGDDGIMQNEPRLPHCLESYPRFLTYETGLESAAKVASNFACIAALGTDGCGFEQPLESALKALWPSADHRVTFLADVNGFGTQGHGDREHQSFLRNDPLQGLSLIVVIVVSDEDDCSFKDSHMLTPEPFLDPNDPVDAELLKQGLNVRCNFNPDDLFATQRYIAGLKALRPDNEDLVMFGAIVGVPPHTVDAATLAATDFTQAASREDFYARIENDPAMQPVVDDKGTPEAVDDTMRASCETSHGVAYPPHRIVEVAKGFGANGMVQSICEDDYTPAVAAIADRIAANLGTDCLANALVRNSAGLVDCDVIWELPLPGHAPSATPTDCDAYGFLQPVGKGAMKRSADGGARCRVAQLAVIDGSGGADKTLAIGDPHGQSPVGWYYDDYSHDADRQCRQQPARRIAFSAEAAVPTGVRAVLDCAPTAWEQ